MRVRLTLIALCALAANSRAHDGPPYPILVDEPFADRTLSVWADPDVGVGTFYLYLDLEASEGQRLGAWVQPSDHRLPEAFHLAEAAEAGENFQYVVRAPFDRRGEWNVRFTHGDSRGTSEISRTIEVTPPGLGGGLDVLWFLSPFLLVAFLWGKAMHQRRQHARAALSSDPDRMGTP